LPGDIIIFESEQIAEVMFIEEGTLHNLVNEYDVDFEHKC